VYLHAINDRDGPSCTNTTEFLTRCGLVYLGTEVPVDIRLLVPQRSVVTSTFCPLTRYINPYLHFIGLVLGEIHHDCEAEMKHNATMGSTELRDLIWLYVFGTCRYFVIDITKRVRPSQWAVVLHAVYKWYTVFINSNI